MVIYPGRVAVVIASGETLFGVGLAIGTNFMTFSFTIFQTQVDHTIDEKKEKETCKM